MSKKFKIYALAAVLNLLLAPALVTSVAAASVTRNSDEGRLCACGANFDSCCVVDADKCNGCKVNVE